MTVDKLFFHSRSRDVPPGKGVYEHINNPEEYLDLRNKKNWRQVLSNFHIHLFVYNCYTYRTIEHAFQSAKIALRDKTRALVFTIESGHEIGLGDGPMAQKHRKLIKLSKEELTTWNSIKNNIMRDIAIQKYKQCKEAMDILRLTRNAELWHLVNRKPVSAAEHFVHLEELRAR